MAVKLVGRPPAPDVTVLPSNYPSPTTAQLESPTQIRISSPLAAQAPRLAPKFNTILSYTIHPNL
ncbi:hypothetical protein TIFTF001_051128 [Ficus carica]|uniref:Uncharacterized protein n=1 Tax=Ficus carica TaxID=3494 RepID=A0AA87YTA7_FICCA|nr:hypothetical protein TIFTF001_051128 [Ficus carica]